MDKIENMQTKERIAVLLRNEIISCRFADGEELTQEYLAELLGVSRMPVREALQILEFEGLIRRLPNRHMQVIGLREDAISQNLRVLAAIEVEIACMLSQAKADTSYLKPSDERQFHTMLSTLIGNHCIEQTHQRLLNIYPCYVWENIPGYSATDLNLAIQTAIRAADENAVNKSVRQYYQVMTEVLIKHVKENTSHE